MIFVNVDELVQIIVPYLFLALAVVFDQEVVFRWSVSRELKNLPNCQALLRCGVRLVVDEECRHVRLFWLIRSVSDVFWFHKRFPFLLRNCPDGG